MQFVDNFLFELPIELQQHILRLAFGAGITRDMEKVVATRQHAIAMCRAMFKMGPGEQRFLRLHITLVCAARHLRAEAYDVGNAIHSVYNRKFKNYIYPIIVDGVGGSIVAYDEF
tara:strand:+ start:176 stop:520 length:345 start_codon:yes stop_codon:yes gene_type:complete